MSQPMDNIVWSKPPIRKSRKVKAFVEILKTRPGEWAEYPYPVNRAAFGAACKRRYPDSEWTVREQPDGKFKAWARWIGMESFA